MGSNFAIDRERGTCFDGPLMRTLCRLALFFCLLSASAHAQPGPKIKLGVRSPITFKESAALGNPDQLKMRLRSAETPEAYDVSKESFEILVPKGYKDSVPHGLFIWISPGDRPSISPEWEKVLADKKLIFIGAAKSGNNRPVFDRMRMAIDANDQLRQLYTVDPKRVYVSGHSGGSRVASMLAVAYADMFTGAACFMGVNFFMPTQGKDGTMYEARYIPHPEIATLAQQESRLALVTGEKDFNLDNTRAIYEQGFKANEFKGVKLFEIPGQAHGAPSREWLDKVLDFLDTGK